MPTQLSLERHVIQSTGSTTHNNHVWCGTLHPKNTPWIVVKECDFKKIGVTTPECGESQHNPGNHTPRSEYHCSWRQRRYAHRSTPELTVSTRQVLGERSTLSYCFEHASPTPWSEGGARLCAATRRALVPHRFVRTLYTRVRMYSDTTSTVGIGLPPASTVTLE